MTDSQPENTPAHSGEEQPFSAGGALREARTRMGLSVADVAHRLKFAPRQVEALEADDFARLPEITFVRGFVRSYARLLQLDPAPLLAALPGAPAPPPPLAARALEEVPFPASAPESRKPNLIWLAAAALLVAAAAAFYLWSHGKPGAPKPPKAPKAAQEEKITALQPTSAVPDLQAPAAMVATPSQATAQPVQQAAKPAAQTAKPAPQAVAPAPQAVAPAPQAAAPAPQSAVSAAAPKRPPILRMEFDEESWVEVTNKEGKVLLSQVVPRGGEQTLNGKPPFSLVIGRSSAVRLTFRGKAVDLAPHTKAEVARLTLE